MSRSVLIIADPLIPVPPITYGGIERIVAMLAEGLSARGWDVTLACHPDSSCPVKQIHLMQCSIKAKARVRNALRLLFQRRSCFELMHSFAHIDLTAAFWRSKKPIIQSFQAPPSLEVLGRRLRLFRPRNLNFTVCGHHMVDQLRHIAPTTAIHNGVDLAKFPFCDQVDKDAPLVFLGRIEQIKGTHTAIKIAQATNRRLIIAGNRSHLPSVDAYFKSEVEPHLSERISYIGPVNDLQKAELLGSAAALLMPVEWDEPFGIVMAEALACGTPVIGTNRGAIPEIVVNGITGAVCQSVQQMIEAIYTLESIDRNACRSSAETRFSSNVIVGQYLDFYEKTLITSG